MEKGLDSNIIKATQLSLGKYVKRPPLTEKLLKKPPFRFLHDIVTAVLKTTGFFEGIFEEHELDSENVKEREAKISFLNKVIFVISKTTGKELTVKSSKIVAGQEPEKTNELLQSLGEALDKNLSPKGAVQSYKEGGDAATKKVSKSTKPLERKAVAVVKTKDKQAKTENNTSTNNAKSNDKTKLRSSAIIKGTSQKIKAHNKDKKDKHTRDLNESNDQISNVTPNPESIGNVEPDVFKGEDLNYSNSVLGDSQEIAGVASNDDKSHETKSYGELEAEKSLKSNESNVSINLDATSNKSFDSSEKYEHNQDVLTGQTSSDPEYKVKNTDLISNDMTPDALSKIDDDVQQNSLTKTFQGNEKIISRPSSVRPSSSRPGAPRIRDKQDFNVAGSESVIVGKINIISENTVLEEEEEQNIVIEENPDSSISQQEEFSSLNQHGHLVQQILDSQKEFSQIQGKTEIEWQTGSQKTRDEVNRDIEQLRFNIQALSRVANPLSKILDHIQEDVEVMRQELQQWIQIYEEANKDLAMQKAFNEEVMVPLHSKIKQLDTDTLEKHQKINNLKIIVYKNNARIDKLLANENVQ